MAPFIEPATNGRFLQRSEVAALFGSLILAILMGRWVFSQFDAGFWHRMLVFSATMFVIGVALLRGGVRSVFLGPLSVTKAVGIGAISALPFYGIAFGGFKILSRALPSTVQSVSSVYAAKNWVDPSFVTLALAGIGFFEEFYWRGWATPACVRLFSPLKIAGLLAGLLLSSAAYGFVHIFAGNYLLVLIAFLAAFYWGALFLRFRSLLVTIISHFLWDLLVFQVAPLVPS